MELKVHKFNHKGCPMYVTVMSGKTIAEISDVDSVDKDPDGYQRQRVKSRCEDLKGYIENTEGLVPGAILINVRPEKVEEIKYSKLGEQDGIEFGTAEFPDGKFAWIMDGQHRVGSFEQLERDIMVPVVITIGLSRPKEGETFNVVNSNQKNVTPSLNYYDLQRYATEAVKTWTRKGEKESEELAYNIAVAVNRNGPWKDRINLTGVRGMKRAVNLKGYMDGLKPVVKDRWFATLPQDRQIELVQTFWEAVGGTWPVAISPVSASILTKTFGVHVAFGIAIDIFHYCDQLDDFSTGKMVELIESIKGVVGDWGPHGPLKPYIGGGRKNVSFVIDFLRGAIRNRFNEMRKQQPAKAT